MESMPSVFCRLLVHFKGRMLHANVLTVLLYRHAADGFESLTYREIGNLCLANEKNSVRRAIEELIDMGLVEQRYDFATSPRKYRVDMDRLEALLREPLPDVPVIPGITPIPAFDELAERLNRPVTDKETT